nr:hypothetical protein [Tanacetum cinerariifolium]
MIDRGSDVLKGVELVKFLLYLVSIHEWLGLSTQRSNDELGGVEKIRALVANGKVSGSRVVVVWMEDGGEIMRARVVSRVVVKIVEKALEQSFRGFSSLDRWKLVHGRKGIKSEVVYGIVLPFLVRIWKRDHHMIHEIDFIREGVRMIVMNVFKESGEKHSDDFPFLELDFQLGENHLKGIKEDALLVLCKGDINSVIVIKQALEEFREVYGLKANMCKSTLFCNNVEDDIRMKYLALSHSMLEN